MCGIAAPAVVGLSRPVWSELAVFVRFPNQIGGCGWWDGPGGQRRCPFALLFIDGASRGLFASEHNEEPNVEP
jgi:hypothetical protein